MYDPQQSVAEHPSEIDLSRATAIRLDLSDVDLGKTVLDIAFANLSQAQLAGATLFRMRGQEANLTKSYCSRATMREARLNKAVLHGAVLHDAILVSASLKGADLRNAQLQRSSVQEAHFEGAILTGANFTGANLNNTFFKGAQFDAVALRSIATGAHHWRDNHNFDTDTLTSLHRSQP